MSHSLAYSHRKDKIHRISLDPTVMNSTTNNNTDTTDYQFESMKKDSFTAKTPYAANNSNKIRSPQHPKNISSTPRVTPLSKILPLLSYNSPDFPKSVRNHSEKSQDAAVSEEDSNSRVREYSLPALKTAHKSQLSHSSSGMFNQSAISSLPFPTSPSHLGIIDVKYALQKDYIEHNPHFSRFNKSVYALDKRETSKITLSKEFYYYPEQAEINQRYLNETKNLKKQEETFSVKVLKENVPEPIELLKDKSCYLKLYAFDKTFPVSVNIERNFGSFEIFISKSHQKPDLGTCEYYIRNEHFQVDYSNDPNVRFVYFRIFALERIQMTLTANFTQAKETAKKPKPLPLINLKAPKKTIVARKKRVYEFFHENMGYEEIRQLKQVINDIREDRQMKASHFGSYRDAVKDNMMVAQDYDEIKQQKLLEMAQKEAILFHNNKMNKEQIRIEKEGKKIYSKYKNELKQIEREWKAEEEIKRQETLSFQRHWASFFTMSTLVSQLTRMKSQMLTLKILRESKANSATQIQRKIRAYIHRPLIIRIQDKENNYQWKEDTNLQTKLMVNLFDAMNLLALNARKEKIPNAETLLVTLLDEAAPLTGISKQMNIYLSNVIRIQSKWQGQLLVYEARVRVFKVCWHQYCLSLIEEETKKKKKKNTDLISKIKENRLDRFARNFIRKKMWRYSKAATIYNKTNTKHDDLIQGEGVDGEEISHKESDVKSSKFFDATKVPSKPAGKEGSTNPSKGKGETNSKVKASNENDVLGGFVKPHMKTLPTKEELKEVFESMVHEIKRELGL